MAFIKTVNQQQNDIHDCFVIQAKENSLSSPKDKRHPNESNNSSSSRKKKLIGEYKYIIGNGALIEIVFDFLIKFLFWACEEPFCLIN